MEEKLTNPWISSFDQFCKSGTINPTIKPKVIRVIQTRLQLLVCFSRQIQAGSQQIALSVLLNVSSPPPHIYTHTHKLHNSLWYCSSLPGSIKMLTAATKEWIECSKRSFYHAAWDTARDWEGGRVIRREQIQTEWLCFYTIGLISTSYRLLQPC